MAFSNGKIFQIVLSKTPLQIFFEISVPKIFSHPGMIFASTTKLFKILIKNIKKNTSVSPTHQDLSNDTTFSQIKSRGPVPLILPILY